MMFGAKYIKFSLLTLSTFVLKILRLIKTNQHWIKFFIAALSASIRLDVDLAFNDLPRIPESLYKVETLKRLNVSNNEITEVSSLMGKLKIVEPLYDGIVWRKWIHICIFFKF